MIVVAEDDLSTQDLLDMHLEKWRYPHRICADGQEALEVIQSHPETRLLLTDIMMPRMKGDALVETVRRMDAFRELPIIIMSGHVHPEDVLDCLSQTGICFHPKPIDFQLLKRQIHDLLKIDRPEVAPHS